MLSYEENLRAILETATAGVVKDEFIDTIVLSIMKLNNSYYVLKDENEQKIKEAIEKIKAEIKKESEVKTLQLHWGEAMGLNKALDIIDKYKIESEK